MKSKGEKERYKHLNEESQRIARRHKKVFLSNQCKEIEENNNNGKDERSRQKNKRQQGTFHAKMGTIKDRNGRDLTEAEILRRGGKNTQKNGTKKDLHDPDNHDGVLTHLEPDILECQVRWALGSITKLVEVMEFQLSYFKS